MIIKSSNFIHACTKKIKEGEKTVILYAPSRKFQVVFCKKIAVFILCFCLTSHPQLILLSLYFVLTFLFTSKLIKFIFMFKN